MFKNLWYVVCASGDLGQAPMPITVGGLDFAAFRDAAGRARVVSDTCIHRGGSLSRGKLAGGDIECPYHGWRFDGEGLCTLIPAQPDRKIAAKARIDAYPTIERYGWVWAFLGDLPEEKRPPLPDLSWVEDPSIRVVRGTFDWDASWDRVVENGLDFAHAPFVHGTTFGDPEFPEIDEFETVTTDWSGEAAMTMHRPARRRRWFGGPNGDRVQVPVKPAFHLSGPCTLLELAPSKKWRIFIASAHLPIGPNRTRTFWMMGRNFLRSPLFDRNTIGRNLRIFNEDLAVLRKVKPERVPDDWSEEVSVRSDALQIAFRRRLKALETAGWKLDERRIDAEFRGRRATAIACPARREAMTAWVIPEAPLLQSEHQSD